MQGLKQEIHTYLRSAVKETYRISRDFHVHSPQHQLLVCLLPSSFHMHDDSIHCSTRSLPPPCVTHAMGFKKNSAYSNYPLVIERESKESRSAAQQTKFSPHSNLTLFVPLLSIHLPNFAFPKLPSNHVLTHSHLHPPPIVLRLTALVLPLHIEYHLMHIVQMHQSHRLR